jgi:hypothetical protein
MLTTHTYLAPMTRMSGAIPLLPTYAPVDQADFSFTFTLLEITLIYFVEF